MSFNFYLKIYSFLKKEIRPGSRVLLALSGGPDSTALFYALLDLRDRLAFKLEIAHVDHGQRKESAHEAMELQNKIEGMGLPFHLHKIESACDNGNLENFFRQERYQFFKKTYFEKECTHLLLAHQREDLEETTLKRFFEGAHLDCLGGIKEESNFEGMRVLRPLLGVSKSELLRYLSEKGISTIDDYTNRDTQFLRARMRQELLPYIEKNFGKSIRGNLVRQSKRAHLLQDYLEKQVQEKYRLFQGPFGSQYTFDESIHPFELDFLLRDIFKKRGNSVNEELLTQIVDAYTQKKANVAIQVNGEEVLFDRDTLYILGDHQQLPEEAIKLSEGEQVFGPWKIVVSEKECTNQLGMHQLFKERPSFRLKVPMGEYFIRAPRIKSDNFYFKKPLSKWLSEHKIPRKIAGLLPVIEQDSALFADFLTGKSPFMIKEKFLEIYLSYNSKVL